MNLKSRQISHPFDLSHISFSPTVILHHFPSPILYQMSSWSLSLYLFPLHITWRMIFSFVIIFFLLNRTTWYWDGGKRLRETDCMKCLFPRREWMSDRGDERDQKMLRESVRTSSCRESLSDRQESGSLSLIEKRQKAYQWEAYAPFPSSLHHLMTKQSNLCDGQTRGEMKKSNIHPSQERKHT